MATERISAKQYGPRYGRKLREKIGKLVKTRQETNVCPYCHYKQIKRLSAGIWQCNKCESRFTGRAYYVGRKLEGLEKAAATEAEQVQEEPEAEEDYEEEVQNG